MRSTKVLGIAMPLLCFAASVSAQLPSGAGAPSTISRDTSITVKVSYDNERGVAANVQVSLASWYGSIIEVRTADGYGNAEFPHVLPGKYKFIISGVNIQTSQTGEIDVADGTPHITQNIQVHKVNGTVAPGGATSALEANVPDNAKKEYEKGMRSIERKDWDAAKKSFEQAIAIYPKYAQAQNGLATSYVNLGQGEKAVETFRAAISNDEHLQMANLYLGHFYYENKNYKEAEPYLLRAESGDPQNAQILTALANCQYRNGEPDLALASARKVHSLKDHKQYAIAHLIAADILTGRNQAKDAAQEYEAFLKEDPKSPMAPKVREALAKIDAAK